MPLNPITAEIAARLRRVMREAGGNQAVADRAGVPVATVNNYMRARNGMKVEALALLAEACGVSLDWLVNGREPSQGLAESGGSSLAVPRELDLATLVKAIEVVEAVTGVAAFGEQPQELAR